ncbi:MAG: GNAT family N-acetyltransferase [Prochloron sp. SP5CPC1]|nr:GNAT family N-acetyltransferase [Candidatus Paraprochloron terpiosi SP5CPC1]
MTVSIKVIDDKSPYLAKVIALGDANKETLGFFAETAFREHAAGGKIIVAIDPQAGCVGYLMYGIAKKHNRIRLVHLCIEKNHRSQGIAKKLLAFLKQKNQSYSGIGLHCRRDYGLDKMWSRLGFIAQHEKDAKTLGKSLTYWWFDFGHPNLLSFLPIEKIKSKLCVIIDYPIFRIRYLFQKGDGQEFNSLLVDVNSLFADWLAPYLELCITDEVFNQINEVPASSEREEMRKFAQAFTALPCDHQKISDVTNALSSFFQDKNLNLDESDLRHLARTISSDVQIFVTSNSSLLKVIDEFYDQFNLSIKEPTDLILQLDRIRSLPEYQPVRLAGTQLRQRKVQLTEISQFSDYFLSHTQGETKAAFQQCLSRFITEQDKFQCFAVLEESQPLALVVYHRHNGHELEIPMLRVSSSPLAPTLASHLIFAATLLSAREKR